MVVETFDALQSYHCAVKNSPESEEAPPHTVLVLDRALHVFPWESLPCMRDLAVSRVPSLAHLMTAHRGAGRHSAGGHDI